MQKQVIMKGSEIMLRFFKKKKDPKDLKEVLAQFKELERKIEKIFTEIEKLKKENRLNFQKIGVVRFNPFSEIGGNQSFSVALLDGTDSGIVITSLYTREGNRVYGKPIKNGKSEYFLSKEEKEAIAQAKQYGNKKSKSNQKASGGSGFRPH